MLKVHERSWEEIMKRTLGLIALSLTSLSSAQFFSDDFNRPDAADLGPNYSNFGAGFTRTIGNQAGNVAATNALSLVNTASYSASYMHGSASVDAFCGSTLSYVAFLAVLGFHLWHGLASFFQTMGLSHERYSRCVRALAHLVTWILILGYVAIPMAVLTGLVGKS